MIDARTNRYYRIGQLIGTCNRPHRSTQSTVYQAVVLRQALDEFEERCKHDIKDLRPVGQMSFKDGSALALMYNLKVEENVERDDGFSIPVQASD